LGLTIHSAGFFIPKSLVFSTKQLKFKQMFGFPGGNLSVSDGWFLIKI